MFVIIIQPELIGGLYLVGSVNGFSWDVVGYNQSLMGPLTGTVWDILSG
jgi:hypothetical protein